MTESKENEAYIDSDTSVRLPIGILFGLVVTVAVSLGGSIIYLHEEIDERINDIKSDLKGKADKGSTVDRYTGKDADKDNEYTKASISALQREFMIITDAIRNEILLLRAEHNSDIVHVHDDIENHSHKHSEIVHDAKH